MNDIQISVDPKPRHMVLRTAHHDLVMAFECPITELFIAGPGKSPPDVIFWGQRVFQFTTLSDDQITYSEAFCFALVEGVTCTRLPDSELALIEAHSPTA